MLYYYICRTLADSKCEDVTFSKNSVDHFIKRKKKKEKNQQNAIYATSRLLQETKTNVSKSM